MLGDTQERVVGLAFLRIRYVLLLDFRLIRLLLYFHLLP
jgi:hypothetical protein